MHYNIEWIKITSFHSIAGLVRGRDNFPATCLLQIALMLLQKNSYFSSRISFIKNNQHLTPMNPYNPIKVLQTMRIIFFGLIAMPTLFAIAVSSLMSENAGVNVSFEDPLILALIILTLMAIPASNLIPRRFTKTLSPETSLQQKLAAFQTHMIVKMAVWDGVANFAIVVALISENFFPLFIGIICILFNASQYPDVNRIQRTILLTSEDRAALQK